MKEKIVLRRIHLGMNKKMTNNELNELMKKLIIEEKYLSEGLILDIENGFIIIIKCDPISGYLTHDTIIYLESTIQPLQRIHLLFNHSHIFNQSINTQINNINKINRDRLDTTDTTDTVRNTTDTTDTVRNTTDTVRNTRDTRDRLDTRDSMDEELIDEIMNRNHYYGPFYITSLKNNINTLINPIINPVTVSGPTESTGTPNTTNTHTNTTTNTNNTTTKDTNGSTPKVANSTYGPTVIKGPLGTRFESQSSNNTTNSNNFTEENLSNEVASVTNSGESTNNSNKDTKGTNNSEEAGFGVVDEDIDGLDPVTEEIYFYEYDENGNEIIIECNGKGYRFFEKLFNLYLKKLLEIPRIFYYGNKHIIGHFNFIISSIIPLNKPGYINQSTEIYFGMDPYEYFDEVIVNPLMDTIPKNYNYDLLKDVKSYFSLNPFKIFRLGDVFTFSGVQFRITHVSKNNTILTNCPKYARINHFTNIIIGEMVKPKVMDLLPIEQVNILRFSAPCYREKLLSQFADNLDPISLDRIQNTTNTITNTTSTININNTINSINSRNMNSINSRNMNSINSRNMNSINSRNMNSINMRNMNSNSMRNMNSNSMRNMNSNRSSMSSNVNIDGGSVSSNINTTVTVTGSTDTTTNTNTNSTKDTTSTEEENTNEIASVTNSRESNINSEYTGIVDTVDISVVDTDTVTEDKLCSVCYEIMLKNENIISLRCGHIFHEDCVNRWLIDKNSCPYCRTLIISRNNSNYSNLSTNISIDHLYYTITQHITQHTIHNTTDTTGDITIHNTGDTNTNTTADDNVYGNAGTWNTSSNVDTIDTTIDDDTTTDDTSTDDTDTSTDDTDTTDDIENKENILEILRNVSKLVLKGDFKSEQTRIFNTCQQYLKFLHINKTNNTH